MHHNSHTANYNTDATFLTSSSPKLQNAIQTGITILVFLFIGTAILVLVPSVLVQN